MEEEILIKKLQGLFEEIGSIGTYRDFKKFLMAIFGHGHRKHRPKVEAYDGHFQTFSFTENNTAARPAAFAWSAHIS